MSRVLVTGGTGAIGGAIVRRLLSDPAYDVRVCDQRPAPRWMREGCEIHTGDLREPSVARRATDGCSHVIHLAEPAAVAAGAGAGELGRRPHTLREMSSAQDNALLRAAADLGVERFTYLSSSLVFERATEYPTSEAHLPSCPAPWSAEGFSKLAGELCCRAAHEEHGLPYTICRPFDVYGPDEDTASRSAARALAYERSAARALAYERSAARALADELGAAGDPGAAQATALAGIGVVGSLIEQALSGERPLRLPCPGEQTLTPVHIDDLADGILTAMGSPQGLGEDFNISGMRELTVAEIARIVWEACDEDPEELALEHPESVPGATPRSWPSVEKAERLLGWRARIEPAEGIAATVERFRERGSIGSRA